MRVLLGSALSMVSSVSFMSPQKLAGRPVSRVAERPVGLPFTPVAPLAIPCIKNDTVDTMLAVPLNLSPPWTPMLMTVAARAI
jgi:hypothetical protein